MTQHKARETVFELDNVTMKFGGLTAVDRLSFDIKDREVVGLIGPNGAGKTTVFNCATQFYKHYTGNIYFTRHDGTRIDLGDLKVTDVVVQGVARTFQNVELVPDLSVLDNVLIGAHTKFRTGVVSHMLKLPKARKEEVAIRRDAEEVLDFMNLSHLSHQFAGGQPYGIMKKIEIARALMAKPRLIILDEPAAGLNDQETDELESIIYDIRDKYNTSVLLIEHDMGFVMDICDRVIAINFGKLLAEDTPKNIQANPDVQEAYLGSET